MARLPVPGSDDGTWGEVLNEFLGVSLNGDGTIQAGAVTASSIQDSSVAESKLNIGAGTNGQVLTKDSTQAGGFKWATTSLTFSLTAFYKSGALTVTAGTQRLPIDGSYTVVGTRLTAGTAPTGADLIIDVNKNGTSIYTTQANRPTITAGQNAGGPGATPDVTALIAGDYLTVDIDQIGSTVAGSDLTVTVMVNKLL
jgi:hypothetical protein